MTDSRQPIADSRQPSLAPSWPLEDVEVRAALEQAFASGDWGRYHGGECQSLAEELAAFHGVPQVMLCCSGTIAVELALRGLGVEPGDEVVLSAYDFPGNFRAVEAVGARPVLVDVSPDTGNLDPSQLTAAAGPQVRAVILSHLHGVTLPMQELTAAAHQQGWKVVEDACQCPGAMIGGRAAGSLGDVGVMSFGGSKLLTSGRGGALLIQDAAVYQRIKIYRERGNDAFPLSELQAAVLRPQLARLQERNVIRRQRADQLVASLADVPAVHPLRHTTPDSEPAYYKLGLLFQPGELGDSSREDFLQAVQSEGVALHAGFRGFARRSERRCRRVGALEHAQQTADAMMVLHHPVLLQPPEIIDQAAAAIRQAANSLK